MARWNLRLRRVFISFALLSLGAAEPETQHGFDCTLPLARRWEVLLHARMRTQPGGLGFYQVRGGPVFSFDVSPRLALIGGYYYTQQEVIDRDFIGGHRYFGGAEGRLWDGRRAVLDARGLAERFDPDEARGFARYRTRLRLSAKSTFAPYASIEPFFDRQGWRAARFAAGLRWNLAGPWEVDTGYFYEERRARIGFDRHMFMTSLHFRKRPGKRGDPDLFTPASAPGARTGSRRPTP